MCWFDRLWAFLMHAHHVLDDLEDGRRDWADLETLPEGLWHYYASSWASFRDDPREWSEFYLPLLSTLGATRAPLRVA